MKRRRKRMVLKLLGIGLFVAASVALVGAFALAEPGGTDVVSTDPAAAASVRANHAAAALTDAHPGDRAVGFLADMVQRETARLSQSPNTEADQALTAFSRRAEEHLIAADRNPAQAQQVLRDLMQQLRGQPPEASAEPQDSTEEPQELGAFGQNVVVEEGVTVSEASVVGGNLTVRGRVLGDAVVVGGNLRLEPSARVEGDAVSVGGNVELLPGARVVGDTVTMGGRVSVSDGAQVDGKRTQIGTGTWAGNLPFAHHQADHGSMFLSWIGSIVKTIGFGFVLALLGIVIAALMPKRVKNVITTVRRKPVMSFFSGLLTLVVTVMATIVLTVTLIGIPLVPVLWIGVGLATLLGVTGVATLVGEVLPGKARADRPALKCLILGFVVMIVVSLIPLGFILNSILLSVALGAVILSRVGANEPQAG